MAEFGGKGFNSLVIMRNPRNHIGNYLGSLVKITNPRNNIRN